MWSRFASLIPYAPEAARLLRAAVAIAPLALGASEAGAFDYSKDELPGSGPVDGPRMAQPAEAPAPQGRGQKFPPRSEDRGPGQTQDIGRAGGPLEREEALPLTTQVSPVPAVGNSWTAQAGIPLVVSGPYKSPGYSIVDAIVGARLSILAYEPFLTDEEKAAFLTKLASDPILGPRGLKVVYWIDDRQQHEACANEDAKRTIPEFALHCSELPSPWLRVRDSQAVLLVDRYGHLYGVARGTESWQDFLTDLLFLFRWDWEGGSVHPGFMRAYKSIRPYWPVVADFMAQRRVAPETLKEAVEIEFSPNPAKPLRPEALRPRAVPGDILAEWGQLTEPQKAFLFLLRRLAKMDDVAIAKRYSLSEANVRLAIASSEVRYLKDTGFAGRIDTIVRGLLGIALSGHSLGGVLSTLGAGDTVAHGLPVKWAHLYGSPRLFDKEAARDYDGASNFGTTLGEVTFRHASGFDFVAHLYPIGFGYKHVATNQERQYLTLDGQDYEVHVGLNREQKRKWFFDALKRDALGTLREIFVDAIDQHRMLESYEHVLRELAKKHLGVVNSVLAADLETTVRRQIQAQHPEIKFGVLGLTDGTRVTAGELREFAMELTQLIKD